MNHIRTCIIKLQRKHIKHSLLALGNDGDDKKDVFANPI